MQPLAIYAPRLRKLGLSFFPCGGPDGKRPLVSWSRFQKIAPDDAQLGFWLRSHSEDNIALLTGQINNISVIDIDDPNVSIEMAESMYGTCAFIVRTPRGGLHLYYRFEPEVKTWSQVSENVDTRSEGGYVVFAGSRSPQTGKEYEIAKGFLPSLNNLTRMKPQALKPNSNPIPVDIISEGQRNTALFSYLLSIAKDCANLEHLEMLANQFNEKKLCPSLPAHEVTRTVASVWAYKTEDRLFQKGSNPSVPIKVNDFKTLASIPKALALWIFVRTYHRPDNTFALDQEEVARLLGWKDRRAVANAIKTLIEKSFLIRVESKFRAHQYRIKPCTKNAH